MRIPVSDKAMDTLQKAFESYFGPPFEFASSMETFAGLAGTILEASNQKLQQEGSFMESPPSAPSAFEATTPGTTRRRSSRERLTKVAAAFFELPPGVEALPISPTMEMSLLNNGKAPSCGSKSSALTSLPCEILETVLDYCSTESLVALVPTCRVIRAAVDEPSLWRRRGERRFATVCNFLGVDVSKTVIDKRSYFELQSGWMRRAVDAGHMLLKIDGRVFDVSAFIDEHPGGSGLLRAATGGDASRAWQYIEHSEHAQRILQMHARPELDMPSEGSLYHLLGRSPKAAEALEALERDGLPPPVSPRRRERNWRWPSALTIDDMYSWATQGSCKRSAQCLQLLESWGGWPSVVDSAYA
jgi:hypothetical protein